MKIKKYQFVTCLLAVYAIFMTFYFGLDLLKTGQEIRFWITFISEIVVIILAYFALRRRDQYRDQRKRKAD
ncbi:MAG: hypothetical protein J1F12_02990 [Muribaculaceae bacterium]|nr:hypothetical protein [Muribaculaceae bacterium]